MREQEGDPRGHPGPYIPGGFKLRFNRVIEYNRIRRSINRYHDSLQFFLTGSATVSTSSSLLSTYACPPPRRSSPQNSSLPRCASYRGILGECKLYWRGPCYRWVACGCYWASRARNHNELLDAFSITAFFFFLPRLQCRGSRLVIHKCVSLCPSFSSSSVALPFVLVARALRIGRTIAPRQLRLPKSP